MNSLRKRIALGAALGMALSCGVAAAAGSSPAQTQPLTLAPPSPPQPMTPTQAAPPAPSQSQSQSVLPSSLSEADAVRLALAYSPTLAAAVADQKRAQLLVAAEEARYGFMLHLDGAYTHSQSPSLSANGVIVPQGENVVIGGELQRHLVWGTELALRVEGSYALSQSQSFTQPGSLTELGPGYGTRLRLSVSQPLLRGAGRDVSEALLQNAQVAVSAAQKARERVASELLRDVLNAYWELVYATEAVDIQHQAQALAQRQRDESAARVAIGSLAPVEVLAFDTQVATLAEAVASARAEQRQRSIELSRLLGLADDTGQLNARPEGEPPERDLPTGDLHAMALSAFPQLGELREAVRLTEVQQRTATEPFRHRLDLNGWVQLEGLGDNDVGPAFSQLGQAQGFSAWVGVVYEMPLDATEREAEAERASLAVTAAQAQLAAASQAVVAQLEAARSSDQAARERLKLALATHAIAQRQLDAERARFATGGSTALQVSQAQDQLQQASLRVLRARIDLVENGVRVAHLTGALLQERALSGVGA